MKTTHILFLPLFMLLANCSEDDTSISFPEIVELNFEFENGTQSWEGDFADYPVGGENQYELSYEFSNLPAPLDTNLGSIKQSGTNHSDDLFMFIRKKVDGLEPNSNYTVSFEIEFASNVADGQLGVGGSPGEGVTIKAGATKIKPKKENQSNHYRMNIDIGYQATSGTDMIAIGDFSNDTAQNEYTLKQIIANDLITVSATELGELWLIVGTDSGFEANTRIYYNSIKVTLEKP